MAILYSIKQGPKESVNAFALRLKKAYDYSKINMPAFEKQLFS